MRVACPSQGTASLASRLTTVSLDVYVYIYIYVYTVALEGNLTLTRVCSERWLRAGQVVTAVWDTGAREELILNLQKNAHTGILHRQIYVPSWVRAFRVTATSAAIMSKVRQTGEIAPCLLPP